MLGSERGKAGDGVDEQQHNVAFDRGRRDTLTAVSTPPLLFLAGSGVSGEAASPEQAEAVPLSRKGSGSEGSTGDRRSRGQSHRPWDDDTRPVGLAGALNGEIPVVSAVLLPGKRLQPAVLTATGSPCSASPAAYVEFGAKSCRSPAPAGSPSSSAPLRRLSPREMEASEDYTRVIARGPSPRTTHIFDDRAVVGVVGSSGHSASAERAGSGGGDEAFLKWCHGCGKDLDQGKDIFIYRGEMAFCSHECRYREMLRDEDF
ncbi:hypothetical protein ACP70R_019271 [Stipagrostis hirtigluma subsp. patula]